MFEELAVTKLSVRIYYPTEKYFVNILKACKDKNGAFWIDSRLLLLQNIDYFHKLTGKLYGN